VYPGKWAQEFPDKAAVIHAETGETISYRELDDRSNRLAQLMWRQGLRPGDHAAVFLENHLRYFEVVWAALRSGLYLTTVNRYLTADEAGYILDDCGARVLIASKRLAEVARELPTLAPRCNIRLMVDGVEPGFDAYEDAIAACPPTPLDDEPAGQFMLYSSGTTGRPKGIVRPLPGYKIHEDAGPVGAPAASALGLRRKHPLPVAGPPLPQRPHRLHHRRPRPRRYRGHDAALRRGRRPARHRAVPGYPQPVGTHHVHPHAEAAARTARRGIRSVVAPGRHPRRRALPGSASSSRCSSGGGPILYEYYGGHRAERADPLRTARSGSRTRAPWANR
jgi:hypothetical protein